ncbi:hypothetical protein [Flavobacterium sp. W21_SRS_FM6]|uniref:hypothetical protein n=1 Tax=Flavobacterium sp. W21_SRS_FM6 TaxID=3240268 RepID=UPI003F935E12
MSTLTNTEVRRTSLLGITVSAIICILLTWQASFKSNASESAFTKVEQNVLPFLDLHPEDVDFDLGIPAQASKHLPSFFSIPHFSTLLSVYFHDISVPQSRAPPYSL